MTWGGCVQARLGWAIGIAAFGFLLGAFIATQIVAATFGYQPALGRPWFVTEGFPLYGPLEYFKWRGAYEPRYPEPFAMSGLFAILGAVLGPAFAIRFLRSENLSSGKSYRSSGAGVDWSQYAWVWPILAGLGVFVAACELSTLAMAAHYKFRPFLGRPWLHFSGMPIYGPFEYFRWKHEAGPSNAEQFAWPGILMFAGAVLGAILTFKLFQGGTGGGVVSSATPRSKPANAWATDKDIKRAGLMSGGGIVLGRRIGMWGERLLTYRGNGHVLVLGATRSGKGRGIVVPTCLNWPGSMVILDPKGELADGDARHGFPGTSGFRATFAHNIRFDPVREGGAKLNPFFEVRRGPNEVRDIQNIVDILTKFGTKAHEPPFWRQSASNLLVGVILDAVYASPDDKKNFGCVRSAMSRMDELADEMRTRMHPLGDGRIGTHPKVKEAADLYLGMEARTRSNVLATAMSYLNLWQDPLICANTASSDFRLSDLVSLDHPVTLYILVPPSDMDRLLPLIHIVLSLTMRSLTESQTHDSLGRPKRHKLLFVLEEFPQLDNLPGFEKMLGIMAGYGMQAMIVAQSILGIKAKYGADNVIMDNCEVTTCFTVNDPETGAIISAYAGEEWRSHPMLTEHRSNKAFDGSRRSVTMREERRPIMLGSDALRLPDNEMLIFAGDCKPIRSHKLRFDQRKLFQERLLPAVTESETLTTEHDWEGIVASDSISPVAPVSMTIIPPTGQSFVMSTDDGADSNQGAKPRSKGI